jgi:hypothetical protein
MGLKLTHLIGHVEVRGLLGTIDPPGETRLGTESTSIRWGNKERLRPRSLQLISSHSHDI